MRVKGRPTTIRETDENKQRAKGVTERTLTVSTTIKTEDRG